MMQQIGVGGEKVKKSCKSSKMHLANSVHREYLIGLKLYCYVVY